MCIEHSLLVHFENFVLQDASSLGIGGLKAAPLYFMMNKKIPKKAPCGEDPGKNFTDDVTPL